MNRLFLLISLLTIAINSLHVFWHLDFSSVFVWFFIKAALIGVLIYLLTLNQVIKGLSVYLQRFLIIGLGLVCLGIHKMELNPFFKTTDEVVQVCVTDNTELTNWENEQHFEYVVTVSGLYDEEYKIYEVTPFFGIFEWRKPIKEANNSNNCKALNTKWLPASWNVTTDNPDLSLKDYLETTDSTTCWALQYSNVYEEATKAWQSTAACICTSLLYYNDSVYIFEYGSHLVDAGRLESFSELMSINKIDYFRKDTNRIYLEYTQPYSEKIPEQCTFIDSYVKQNVSNQLIKEMLFTNSLNRYVTTEACQTEWFKNILNNDELITDYKAFKSQRK